MNFGNFDHDRDFVNFGSWTWICSFVSRTGISTVIVNFGILGFNNRGQNSRSWVQDFKFPKFCSLSIFTKLRSWSTFTKFVGVINIPEIHVRETNFLNDDLESKFPENYFSFEKTYPNVFSSLKITEFHQAWLRSPYAFANASLSSLWASVRNSLTKGTLS